MKLKYVNLMLPIGMMIVGLSQIASYFIEIPDALTGSLIGLGIGLILLSFIRQKPKKAF